MSEAFRLVSEYEPAGDQPRAIAALVEGIERGDPHQTLLGVTGSGKSFTVACAVEQVSNTGFVEAGNACASVSMLTNAVGGEVQPSVPGIAVNKIQIPASPQIGQPITYQIVVTNTGTATIDQLSIVDTVSPVMAGVTTQQPTGYAAPLITQVTGGTRYAWSGMAVGAVAHRDSSGAWGMVASLFQLRVIQMILVDQKVIRLLKRPGQLTIKRITD